MRVAELGGSAIARVLSSRKNETMNLRCASDAVHSKPGAETMVAWKRIAGVPRWV